ncbi:MAG: DUF3892 domain-containing protein [Patescibacteria group bacterium]|nr:DUF3892 domain-containing protein [Patescibacteria group bacterium]
MARHRITCIVKPNPENRHEHITHVGCEGESLLWKRSKVIEALENKTDSFYVREGGEQVEVIVAYPRDGRDPYIRTYTDGVWKDNLLALKQCVVR